MTRESLLEGVTDSLGPGYDTGSFTFIKSCSNIWVFLKAMLIYGTETQISLSTQDDMSSCTADPIRVGGPVNL